MRLRRALALVPAATLLASPLVLAGPAQAAVGIHVSGRSIVEANGSNFIMRGTSHPHAWYASRTTQALRDIKSLGANTVRVVFDTTVNASAASSIISQCKSNRLICILELHNTTGLGDTSAITLDAAANYWLGLKSVLVGQENYIIVNIGNEPIGNANVTRWTSDTTGAIQKLRSNGFQHALMVDGPNWGQDWSGTMRNAAPSVEAADPQHDTIFSVHMYGVYGQASTITTYLNSFVSRGLPLVVGEFGNDHSDGPVDEDTIMATAQSQGIGYLGWSWSGNGSPVQYLDQTNGFNVNSLTTWGRRLFDGANGIKSTSREASIYSGQQQTTTTRPTTTTSQSTTTSTTSPATTTSTTSLSSTTSTTTGSTDGGRSCTAAYSVANSWGSGFVANITVTAGGAAISGWRITLNLPGGTSISNSWNGVTTGTSGTVQVANAAYNGALSAGGSTNFGFQGSGSGSGVTASCTAI